MTACHLKRFGGRAGVENEGDMEGVGEAGRPGGRVMDV